MKWTKNNRADGRIEWVCKHGIGHADLNRAKVLAEHYGHDIETWTVHGCDGCCDCDDFPGKLKNKCSLNRKEKGDKEKC